MNLSAIINRTEFNLTYVRNSDQKVFYGKSITKYSYCLIDSENPIERIYLNYYTPRTRFKASPENKHSAMLKMGRAKTGKRRPKNQEAFKAYLNERSEVVE